MLAKGKNHMKHILLILFMFMVIISCSTQVQDYSYEQALMQAESGNAVAQTNLASMYLYGTGVNQNDAEAVKWFRLAAEQGYSKAQHNLGVMHYNGRGVTKNDQEAVRWLNLAAEQGDAKAQRTVNLIEQGSNPRTQTNTAASNNTTRNCTSNATEINRQIQNISQAYDARLEDLRSRSLQAGLRGTAAYGLGGYSRGVAESGLDRERDQLTLQRTRDIADLRSRIVEICDPIPAPRDNSAAIERGTSIATTLQELNELFESGALTDEEFQAAKRKALGLD
jgi:hypothetical protein